MPERVVLKKVTLVGADGESFSVMYPERRTNLLWHRRSNEPKVVCEAPETGIEYLSGFSAGNLDSAAHSRIKKEYVDGWGEWCDYLMPNPNLADEVRTGYRWLDLFDASDNDGVAPERIANAVKVILEAYDLNDRVMASRCVYDASTKKVTKEKLRDWPHASKPELDACDKWVPVE